MSSLDVRAIEVDDLRKQPCPSTKQEFRVFLSEAAFDRAVERGDNDTTREIGGVLVGELLRDDAGPYLKIEATIDALHAEEKGAELTFTHATWEHIHKEMDSRHKDKKVVGWYHTHPGFGIFLSDRDQFIHKSFFNLPFQVAFVYDPKSREHGMFTWHDNEVWRARRFWIGPREQVWDGPRVAIDQREQLDAHKAQAESAAKAERSVVASEASPPGTLAMFGVVGIILALVGGVVGHWFGVGQANQALAEAQLAIAGAKADGVKIAVASLQSDLVGILRDTFSDDAMHRPITEAVAAIDPLISSLPPESTAALQTARASLVQLAQARGNAQAELNALAAAVHNGNGPSQELVHELAEQRAGLGAMYAELAVDAAKTDAARARRLLITAAHLDPGNQARYEKQLQTFDPKAQLPTAIPSATPSATPTAIPTAAPGQGEPQ